jgi:DNA-binding transcriptional LysR family regulator
MSAGQLLAEGQLRQHRQVVLRDSHPERGANAGWLGAAQRITVDHLHTAVETMRSWLGFGWLPEHQAREETELTVLPVEEGLCPEAAMMLYRQRELMASPAHQSMMESLVDSAPG